MCGGERPHRLTFLDTGMQSGSTSLGVIREMPHPYYLSPGQGGDESGPYAPPAITRNLF